MKYYFEEPVKADQYIAEIAYTDKNFEKKATVCSILIEALITLEDMGVRFDSPKLKIFKKILDDYDNSYYSEIYNYDINLTQSKLKKKGFFGTKFNKIDYAALIDVKIENGHIMFPLVVTDYNIPGGNDVLTFFVPKMPFSKSMVELFNHEDKYDNVKFEKRYKELCKNFVEYINRIEME